MAAIGGDGTTLKALHAAAASHTPVIGVAYGSLGVLTSVPATELVTALDRFAAGEWRPRRLPALAVMTPKKDNVPRPSMTSFCCAAAAPR